MSLKEQILNKISIHGLPKVLLNLNLTPIKNKCYKCACQ